MTKINLLPHLVTEKQKEVNDLFCNTPLLFNLLDVGQEFLVLVFLHGIFIRLIFHQRIVLHDEIYVLVTPCHLVRRDLQESSDPCQAVRQASRHRRQRGLIPVRE